MRILLGVHQFFPRCTAGTEVITLQMAHGLRRRGHDVFVVTGEAEWSRLESTPPTFSTDEFQGIEVNRIHFGARRRLDPISPHVSAPDRVRWVAELVRRRKPDVVHLNHLGALSGSVIPEIRSQGVPVVFTATDFWTICSLATLRRRFDGANCDGPGDGASCVRCLSPMPLPESAARAALAIGRTGLHRLIRPANALRSLGQRADRLVADVNRASRILCPSHFLASVLIRHGVDESKVRIVPYGVDLGTLPEAVGLPARFTREEPLRLGFVGTLDEHKGAHVVLQALIDLGARRNSVALDLYGPRVRRGDSYFRRLTALIREATPAARYRGVYEPSEVGRVVRGFHALVVPSLWYENTPLVVCSALDAGVPVIVSRMGGMTEAIIEGETGLSVPAGDAASLARLLGRLLDDAGELARLQGHLKSRRRRDVDAYLADLEEIYREVREESGERPADRECSAN